MSAKVDLADAIAKALATCRDIHWPKAIMDSLRAANLDPEKIGWANLGAAIEAERRRRPDTFTSLGDAAANVVAEIERKEA